MDGISFELFGIGGAVLVSALLEMLKAIIRDKDGQPIIKDRWAVIAALALGVVLSLVAQLLRLYPAMTDWVFAVLAGILAGLSSSGVFSLAKRR